MLLGEWKLTLTRDSILALEAGPEMDALVAERVFQAQVGMAAIGPNDTDVLAVWDMDDGDYSRTWRDIPQFSTQIADAWRVVEHLGKDFCEVHVTSRHGTSFQAELLKDELCGGPDGIVTTENTAPLAI